MDEARQKDFREICGMIDTIKSGRDFCRVMNQINGGRYSVDVINTAREFKQCFNSVQYEPQQEAPETAADNQQEAGAAGQRPPPQAGEINLAKPSFTNDDSPRRTLYLASRRITRRWRGRCQNWDLVRSQPEVMFAGRAG